MSRSRNSSRARIAWLCCAVAAGLGLALLVAPDPRAAAGLATPNLRADLDPGRRLSFHMEGWELTKAMDAYSELTGCAFPGSRSFADRLDRMVGGRFTRWKWIRLPPPADSGIRFHGDGRSTAAELKEGLDTAFATNGLRAVLLAPGAWRLVDAGS